MARHEAAGTAPLGTPVVLAATAFWLVLAAGAGAAGLLAVAPPPFPQLVIAGLVVLLLGLLAGAPRLRAWALAVDIRGLVLFHLVRFVGLYFLVLYLRGELPWAFAVPGGLGDIAVAMGALAIAVLAPRRGRGGRTAYAVWNAVGLADIVLVVATAARLALADPGSMRALTHLPLALLPTFVVPIIVATHVVIFARLRLARTSRTRGF